MAFDIDSALGIHPQALVLRAKRAEVLARNLANVDTPNYKARDIDFRQALGGAMGSNAGSSAMKVTHGNHIGGGMSGASGNAFELIQRKATQVSIDGNTVDAQKEHAEFMRNAVRYQASLQFVTGRIRGLMTAIRGE